MFSESFQNARPSGKFEVGKVIGLTFGAIGRDWLMFLVLAVVLVGLPTAAVNYLFRGADPLKLNSAYGWRLLVTFGQAFTLSAIFYGAIAWTVWTQENGQKPGLVGSLRAALSAAIGLIGVTVATNLAVVAGLVLLIVPGVIANVAFWVAIPACATEKLGVVAAMRRSLELTRGQRWRLFLMLVAIFLLVYVPSFLLNIVLILGGHLNPGATLAVQMISIGLRTSLSAVVFASATACSYFELRGIKEGVGADNVARVFS